VSRHRCVDTQNAAGFPVSLPAMQPGCRLGVRRLGGQGVPEPTARQWQQADLVTEIRVIHADSDGAWGRHA
jgi:hypothetical protein